ncbi:type IV pilin N-terminal domain-containing protein [Haloarcula sp. CGMCC 1.6347]|uniref:type IV pilin N-terminal domain-containing protein n=1 Tax=Haloarcula sp. CGMCC 1.6347 TaxID=3111455 RepID=UPI00300F285C
MDIKQLIHDDDAVSPVIGVILMVAITVILAAVIASFVLGLGDQAQQATPQASFSFDYEGGTERALTITHDGGDSISPKELYVRGSNMDNDTDNGDGNTGQWTSDAVDGSLNSDSEVTAGSSARLGDDADDGVPSDYEVRVVYETQEGDSSATLAQDTGPDA